MPEMNDDEVLKWLPGDGWRTFFDRPERWPVETWRRGSLLRALAAALKRHSDLEDAANNSLRQIQNEGSPPPGGLAVALEYYGREIRKRAEDAEGKQDRTQEWLDKFQGKCAELEAKLLKTTNEMNDVALALDAANGELVYKATTDLGQQIENLAQESGGTITWEVSDE